MSGIIRLRFAALNCAETEIVQNLGVVPRMRDEDGWWKGFDLSGTNSK